MPENNFWSMPIQSLHNAMKQRRLSDINAMTQIRLGANVSVGNSWLQNCIDGFEKNSSGDSYLYIGSKL